MRAKNGWELEASTYLPAAPDQVWEHLMRPALLRHVAFPLVLFVSREHGGFPDRWREGPHRVWMFQFGFLPLGPQTIGIEIGPLKIHLSESELPPLDDVVAAIRAAHEQGRNAAIHALTRIEALYAVAAYEAAGAWRGDRVEHLHVAPPDTVEAIARLGLTVCTSPAMVAARRSRWRADLDAADFACVADDAVLRRAGIPVLHGSDAPYGPLSACCPAPSAASAPDVLR